MKPHPSALPELRFVSLSRFASLLALASAAVVPVLGQVAATPAAPAAAEPAQVPVVATKPAPKPADETVQLSPFQIVADRNDTYDATNTNSVTGTNLPLDQIPLDAKIFNRTMMDELGVSDVSDMLAQFGGLGPAILSPGTQNQSGLLEGDAKDYKAMSSRGLRISNPRRDGFLRSDTSLMDAYDVESTEIVMGSNSLLFGSGDAGGVINVVSKRGQLDQKFARFTAGFNSEGAQRYTADVNVANKMVGVRVNVLGSEEGYFRPILHNHQRGLQVAPVFKPFSWLTVTGEYRNIKRDHINSGNPKSETVRAPLDLFLTNGERMDNQPARKISGLGGPELTNGVLTLTSQDSISGAYKRHNYTVEGQSIVLEARATRDLHFEFRYGQDIRENLSVAPSSTVVFHPDAPGNLYTGPDGEGGWAMNTNPIGTSTQQGARGFKFSGAYTKDLGKWGKHWLNAMYAEQNLANAAFPYRFYEVDAAGNTIQNPALVTNAEAGRNVMPTAWVPAFDPLIFSEYGWRTLTLTHPNGKTYHFEPRRVEGAVAPTPGNPLGISGPVDPVTGIVTSDYTRTTIYEKGTAFSLTSDWWKGRINTMAGVRFDEQERQDFRSLTWKGPVDYTSTTLGAVFDTPIKGLRGYFAYATNGNPNFDAGNDIFDQPLPVGRGTSKEAGIKVSMWDHRLSGNVTYYQSKGENYAATLGGQRDLVDPEGINGRNGGDAYAFDRTSDGLDVRLSIRPIKAWQVTLNYSQANGSERSNIELPIFYNDQFNTTTVGGQTVVGRNVSGTVVPFTVRSVPSDPSSAQIPLTLAMMRDVTSPYFAVLDPNSGEIVNAAALGLNTPGVGTGQTGVEISQHQLGFVPSSPTVIVRRAGEETAGYPEHAFSLINRYQFDGRLKGLILGLSVVYNVGYRAYMYTDAAAANARVMKYYPDVIELGAFAIYRFKPLKTMNASVRLQVTNLLDNQETVALPDSANGRIVAYTYQYTPLRVGLSAAFDF